MIFALAAVAPACCAGFDALEIVPFDVPAGINLPDDFREELKRDLVDELQNTRVFAIVFLSDQKSEGTPPARLRLTGSITHFEKGNRAERLAIGLGAGKTSLKAHIRFIDTATGTVRFESDVSGRVLGAGDSKNAAMGLAKAVARDAKKKL